VSILNDGLELLFEGRGECFPSGLRVKRSKESIPVVFDNIAALVEAEQVVSGFIQDKLHAAEDALTCLICRTLFDDASQFRDSFGSRAEDVRHIDCEGRRLSRLSEGR